MTKENCEGKMETIKKIRVIPLVRKLEQPFEGSTYKILSRNTLYVQVETSQGVMGEAFGGDEDIYQDRVVEIANNFLAPLLIGEELWQIENLWERMYSVSGLPFHNRGIHTLDLINHAVLMQAIAIIDIGLWDALGKSMGQPLYKLLGSSSDRVPVIGIGGYYRLGTGTSELREEINRLA
jgi:D-galactarolactone cycloisomerase